MKPSLATGSGWLQRYIYCTYIVFILCVCSLFSSPGHLPQVPTCTIQPQTLTVTCAPFEPSLLPSWLWFPHHLKLRVHFFLWLRSLISGFKAWLFVFYRLVSPSTNLQMPPLLAFTLSHSTLSLYFWCPPLSQGDYPCAVLVLRGSGNQEIFIPGTYFNRNILSFTLHWILCSLRFSINAVSTILSPAANTMSNTWDSQSTNVHL